MDERRVGLAARVIDSLAADEELAGRVSQIDVADDRTWPAWHVWDETTAFVVSGPGEPSSSV